MKDILSLRTIANVSFGITPKGTEYTAGFGGQVMGASPSVTEPATNITFDPMKLG